MKSVAAAVCTGLAAWCSLGTVGLVEASATDARVAVLPPWWLLPVLAAAAYAAIRLMRLTASQVSPVFGSAVVLLPWLPFPVPPAALLWTGPFNIGVWAVVLAGVVMARRPEGRSPWLTDESRAPIAAAAMALALYGASAWWLSPVLPEGDAPHYLIIAQSLIRDGDLQIENNHQRGDYLDYSLLAAEPQYLRRGVNGAIYPIHAPGLPVVIAPAMWLFGYPGAVAFLGIVGALSTALVWRLSWRVTASASAAWFGWACCALTTPFFFQATQVFADGLGATCVLVGIVPLMVREGRAARQLEETDIPRNDTALWLLSGVSLGALPWLHTRLAIVALAAAFGLCFRMRSARQFLVFAAVPILSAAAWLAFFYEVYGTPDPTAPFGHLAQTSLTNLRNGVPGMLFDQQFGLISNAPVYGFVLSCVIVGAVRLRRWSWELMALIGPYMVGVGMYEHWWGGTSAPARLLAPIALVLAVGAARMWQDARTNAARAVYFGALAASVVVEASLVVPDRGRLLFNFRDGTALWAEWASDLIDLPRGLPSLFTDDPVWALAKAAIWIASALAAWLALLAVGRLSGRSRGSVDTAFLSGPALWCLAAVPMVALTIVWRVGGVPPLTPTSSTLGLLRHASASTPLAYDFGARRFRASTEILSRVRVRSDRQRRPTSPAPLLAARDVPPGTYLLQVTSGAPAEGALTVRVGDTSLPFWTAPASRVQLGSSQLPIVLPVSVRSLIVEGNSAAVGSISSVELEPVSPLESAGRTAARSSAHRAAGYASSQVFFLDENAYPEPTGFWVAGGRTARTVVSTAGQALTLLLRNAPVENTVVVDWDGERRTMALGPGEERTVTLSRVRSGPGSLSVTSLSGFRPSQIEPGNLDLRYLGCWVEAR